MENAQGDPLTFRKFLTTTKIKVPEIISKIELLIDSDYVDIAIQFRDNLFFFKNSIDNTLKNLENDDYKQALVDHGLVGKELERKLALWQIDLSNYNKMHRRFQNFIEKNNKKDLPLIFLINDLPKNRENWPENKKRKILLFRRISDDYKKYGNKLLESTDIILDSAAIVFPPLGIGSEFKKSLEFVTKEFHTPLKKFVTKAKNWLNKQ
jgi:hypothetical protein